ncbi:MAG: response regulator [Myxococcales bacterium]|nr:response regulator [Myxococcales bacterium]
MSGSPRVLVADDEPKVRALVVQVLRGLGCDVLEAGDGDEAWDLWDEHRPALLVLDVMMPYVTGWELCRRVKEAAHARAERPPRILMLTGIGAALNAMTSPLFQADDWIDKPFSLGSLTAKLRALVGRAEGGPGAAPVVKNAAAKRLVAKKATAKKPVARKATAKKATAKKPVARKAPARPVAKTPAAKKATARRKRPPRA